jgi:hypothetical protein
MDEFAEARAIAAGVGVTDYVPDPIRIFVYSDGIATAADPQISTFGPSASVQDGLCKPYRGR